MLVSLTVGKVDAGVAVLLTEDKRLIEFPSILLPPDIISGSIVDINVSRNFQSEQKAQSHFAALQDDIFHTFGQASPSPPVLRCRNATQTSVVLEWDPVSLATAELRSLSLYRNGSKAGNIPRDKLSTKISGLAIDTDYTFHLVLRTTAGTYTSDKLTIKTQKMTDLTGITVTPGVMPAQLRDDLAATVDRIGAKLIDTLRIDTTHFVCTEGRGQAWEKAVEMNVPVVVPDWVKGCEREGRIVGVRGYYLNADPKLRQMGPGAVNQSQSSLSSASQPPPPAPERRPSNLATGTSQLRVQPPMTSPRIEHTPPTPERERTPAPKIHTNGVEVPPTPPPKFVTDNNNNTTSTATAAPTAPSTEPPAAAPSPPTVAVAPAPEIASTAAPEPAQPTGLGLGLDLANAPTDDSTLSASTAGTAAAAANTAQSISRAHTPDISPRTPHPARFEKFEQPSNALAAVGIPHAEVEVETETEAGSVAGIGPGNGSLEEENEKREGEKAEQDDFDEVDL